MLSAVADIVLSSSKLNSSDNFNVENRSLRNILNNIGPSIDPCSTRDSHVRKSLKTLLTCTFCFLQLRYEYMKVTVFRLRPQACSFAISKSCGIQSNAFDKSMRTVLTRKFSSSDFVQFSISLIKTWLVLYFFLYTAIYYDRNQFINGLNFSRRNFSKTFQKQLKMRTGL